MSLLGQKMRAYFDNFGPSTPIRTTWHDGVEYWEVPADDMRDMLATKDEDNPVLKHGSAENLLMAQEIQIHALREAITLVLREARSLRRYGAMSSDWVVKQLEGFEIK